MGGDSVKIVATGIAAAICGAAIAWNMYKRKENARYQIPKELKKAPHYKELRLAVRLALVAGNNMMAHLETKGTDQETSLADLGIATKSQEADFCTAIDVLNETIVTDAIREHFPGHKIIGEESTGTGEIAPLTDDPTWIIDPIDGTTNFASGLPLECVSIGFCVGGKPVMGCVFAPMTRELYVGIRGHGSFRNGVRISLSDPVKSLSKAVVCYEFGYLKGDGPVERAVKALENVKKNGVSSIRTLGSGVLDICWVATGRLDVVYAGVSHEGWKPWDYCAGFVVATEAGCVMEALIDQEPGKEFDLYSTSLVCAVSKELTEETRSVAMKGL